MFRSYRARAVICMGALLSLLLALPTGIPVTSPAFADDASVGISADASAGAQVEAGNNAGDTTAIDQPSSTDTSASDSADSNNADSAEDQSDAAATDTDAPTYAALDPGTFFLTSVLPGHRVLDATGGSVKAGTPIQLYGRNDTVAQQFVLEDLGNSQYAFKTLSLGCTCPTPMTPLAFQRILALPCRHKPTMPGVLRGMFAR